MDANPTTSQKMKSYIKQHVLAVILFSLGILLMVVAAGILLFSKSPSNTPQSPNPTSSNVKHHAVIQITASGFVPSTLKVQSNTEVTWVNEDTAPHLVAADPYPTHSDLPSLVSPKALGNKESYTYLFTKPRTIHYHDDLHPLLSGSIVVK